MSLQHFLQGNQAGSDTGSMETGASAVTEKDFAATTSLVFNNIIEPFITRAIDLFSSNGYKAQKGQLLEPGGYAFAGNAVSLSVSYKNVLGQWDFFSDVLNNKITIRFMHTATGQQPEGKLSALDRHFSPENITSPVLEKIIEEDLSRVALHEHTDSQSIAQEADKQNADTSTSLSTAQQPGNKNN